MAIARLKVKEPRLFTVNKYLEMERKVLERHEYVDGDVFEMAGESDEHGIVSANLVGELYAQLKGKNCSVRTKDTKIKTGGFAQKMGDSTKGMFSYPDLVVICGEAKFHDKKKDIVVNPRVIIEVLSESIEIFDRNDKFTRFKMFNETLTDYILVSQDKPLVEHFIRQDDDGWKVFTYIGLDKVCSVDSIDCKLKLSDIYDRIKFSRKTLKFLKEIENIK